MVTDYHKMNVEELIALKTEIEALISQKQKEKKAELKKKFQEMAENAGLSVEEILSSAKERKPVSVKYRNGENTWSGRGKRPNWVKEILANGESLETYEINNS